MAIVINGSGTVTGLSVGGLPDGTVDAGTVASDVATQAELDAHGITTAQAAAVNSIISNGLITGGMVSEYSSGGVMYRAHVFLNSGDIAFAASKSVDFLLVGGGGGSAGAEGHQGASGGAAAGKLTV